ncbi:MAG: rhomboid family intramembrane serine protease [Rhizobiaceae bacterium]
MTGNWQNRPASDPAINLAPVVVATILALVAVHAARVFLLDAEADLAVLLRFAFIPAAVEEGGPLAPAFLLRFVSHNFLHGDSTHLAINAVWLAVFGSPLAVRIGATRFVLFTIAVGAAGASLFWALHPGVPALLIGASGAISGMTGAAARLGFRVDRSRRPSAFAGALLPAAAAIAHPLVLRYVLIWFGLNIGIGVVSLYAGGPLISWEAHAGGFLAGFFGFAAFDRRT